MKQPREIFYCGKWVDEIGLNKIRTMKTMKKLLAFVCLAFISVQVSALPYKSMATSLSTLTANTTEGVFGSLNAHRQQTNVVLTWTVVSPDVVGYVIEKSFDGVTFFHAGNATADAARRNKFTDNSGDLGHLYYKIGAVMADGSVQYSEVASLRLVSRKG